MMPDNVDQNLRRGADSLQLFHGLIDQRLSFCVQLLRLFDHRLCPVEKIDQRLARRQRFLNLPKLCIAETGSVTNEVHEPVLQHDLPCYWLYRWPIQQSTSVFPMLCSSAMCGARAHEPARRYSFMATVPIGIRGDCRGFLALAAGQVLAHRVISLSHGIWSLPGHS